MADENNVEMENAECGASCGDGSGGDCCSPSGGGGGAWKTIIFVFIIVLAGTVAARSLLNSGADAEPCVAGSAPCGISADAGQCGGGEKVACDKAGAKDEACAKKADCPLSADEACPFEKGEDCCAGEGEKCAGHDDHAGHAGHAGHGDHADHDGHGDHAGHAGHGDHADHDGHGHGHGHDHGSSGDTDACPMSSSPSLVDAPCSSNADAENAEAGCCPTSF